MTRARIRLWTDDSLRAWAPDCVYPLSTAEQRAALLQATGGWPQLVEAAVRAARNGVADSRARQEAAGSLADSLALKEFLLSVGLSTDPVADEIVGVAADWSDEMGVDDLATLVDAEPRNGTRHCCQAGKSGCPQPWLERGRLPNRSADRYAAPQ